MGASNTGYGNGQYINGAWKPSDGAEGIPVENPATEETLAEIPIATESDVEDALDAARNARAEWRRTPAVERGNLLREVSRVLQENIEELSRILVEEQGKTKSIAEFEVGATAEYVRYMADWDRRIEGEILPSDDPGETIHLIRQPLGVVAAIVPWNFPIFVLFRKLAPALVTGNTVVAKPSEVTPLATLRMWELVEEEVSFPEGVVNMVTGDGEVGEQLVTSKKVDMISMTGHRDTGKTIARQAADNLTKTSLELGGKAPAIVWKDADVDKAVDRILKASNSFTGQLCTCAERIYVHSDIRDEFERKYVDAASQLTMGNPMDDPDMGPHVSADELQKTVDAIDQARDEGVEILTGGGRPEGEEFSKGHWYEHTVVSGVGQDSVLMKEEVFGPVSPIMSVSSLDEAIEYANDTEYGLAAYIYTSDYNVAMQAAHEIEFGETYVNRTLGEAIQGHHIGWNESGTGGEDGKHGVLKYTQLKTVYHNYGDGDPGW